MAQHYNPLPQSDLAPQPQQYGGSPAPQYYVVDEVRARALSRSRFLTLLHQLPAGAVPLNVAQPPQYAAQPQVGALRALALSTTDFSPSRCSRRTCIMAASMRTR